MFSRSDRKVGLPKRRRRILLITQWFDPEPTFKGLLFAQELTKQGHDVRVLTGFPNYPGGKLYDGYRIRPFQRELIDGISVLRVPLYPSHNSSGLDRALNYLSFAFSASVAVILMQRPDVAYVYHPPATVGVPAIVLKLAKGVPYVYDVQDLWPDTLAATGMIRNPRVLRLIGTMMNRVYRSASRLVVLSEGFRNTIVARSIPAAKVHVVPNWADEKQIDVTEHRATPGPSDDPKFTVTFAGNMGKAQALTTLLEAAELLKTEEGLRFLLVGGGLELDNLKRLAAERGLNNVVFVPRMPISEIGQVLSRSQALLVHLREDALFEITIPSKTQAYLMAGKPILMGVRGDAAAIVREAQAGICFEPENPSDLADAVRAIMRLSEHERQEMGASGQRYYREKMSLGVGAREFAQILEMAAQEKPAVQLRKRIIDVIGAGAGLLVTGIPMGIVALLVKRKLGSPVLFKQIRPGKHGEPFEMLKFRTMTDGVDESGQILPDGARLTDFGRLLRSSSLDELPGLWNVLRGDMSLVGPRPLLTRYTPYFTREERARLNVKPGITGWAQVNGRNTTSWDKRLALDVWYVNRLSTFLDLKIIGLTVLRVFKRSGVIVDPESVMRNLDDERKERAAS
ncbi:sugar transferase [Arthrobacter sp. NPDC057009]|uniref:sugar transferase n=1 Tax=Arthrobacter sp. NPDC057009 TaxID=3345996 RepID=UPI003634B1F2